jgi:hypothetical protein
MVAFFPLKPRPQIFDRLFLASARRPLRLWPLERRRLPPNFRRRRKRRLKREARLRRRHRRRLAHRRRKLF